MVRLSSPRIQKRKWLGLSVIAFALVVGGIVAQAQQPARVPRIGYLSTASTSTNPARYEAFRQGLRELGYVEGKNISIEYRALAADLVRLKVDVIVTPGATSTRAAKQATSTIPIVMRRIPIPLETDLSPALRDQAGTLLAYQTLTGS